MARSVRQSGHVVFVSKLSIKVSPASNASNKNLVLPFAAAKVPKVQKKDKRKRVAD